MLVIWFWIALAAIVISGLIWLLTGSNAARITFIVVIIAAVALLGYAVFGGPLSGGPKG
jgi:vacuolar-type H+-ATPase subunit I/STV1